MRKPLVQQNPLNARNERIYLKTSSLDTPTLNIKFQLLKKKPPKKSKARRKRKSLFFSFFLPHTPLPTNTHTYKKGLSSPVRIEYSVIKDWLEWVEKKECLIRIGSERLFDGAPPCMPDLKEKKFTFPGGDKRKWTNACDFTSKRYLKPFCQFLCLVSKWKEKGVRMEIELYWGFAWTTKGIDFQDCEYPVVSWFSNYLGI